MPRQTCAVYRPERRREVEGLVAGDFSGEGSASGSSRTLISRGLGRAYGDAALNEGGGVVLHTRLDRFLAFDPDTGVVRAEAGVSYDDLLRHLLRHGWFPSVTPGTRRVTLGGAVAADVHGKNHHRDGSLSEFVDEIELLTGSGEVVVCSREADPQAFRATLGGMGLTGVILSVRLRLRPVESAWMRVRYEKTRDLDDTLERFAELDARFTYSAGWLDCLARGRGLGRSVLMFGEHASFTEVAEAGKLARGGSAGAEADGPGRSRGAGAEAGEPLRTGGSGIDERRRAAFHVEEGRGRLSVPAFVPGPAARLALNDLGIRAFNSAYYRMQRRGERLVPYGPFFYPLDAVRHWNRIYGRDGFIQHQVVFPLETSRAGIVELLEHCQKSGRPSYLAVIKRFGPGRRELLSFPREGYTLALDIPRRGDDFPRFARALEEITLRHGGRVYLAKDAYLSAEGMAAMYPELERFREIKTRLDPECRFSSSLARRVGIVDGPAAATGGRGAGSKRGAKRSTGSGGREQP